MNSYMIIEEISEANWKTAQMSRSEPSWLKPFVLIRKSITNSPSLNSSWNSDPHKGKTSRFPQTQHAPLEAVGKEAQKSQIRGSFGYGNHAFWYPATPKPLLCCCHLPGCHSSPLTARPTPVILKGHGSPEI